jgi:hypothetical protein
MLVAVVAVVIFLRPASQPKSTFPAIPTDKWQAVFLENNQVYFGKLTDTSDAYVTLTNVFYLRAGDTLGADKTAQNINLVKLGGEFHRPDDAIFIPKAKILFWENLADTSPVTKTIISSKK